MKGRRGIRWADEWGGNLLFCAIVINTLSDNTTKQIPLLVSSVHRLDDNGRLFLLLGVRLCKVAGLVLSRQYHNRLYGDFAMLCIMLALALVVVMADVVVVLV